MEEFYKLKNESLINQVETLEKTDTKAQTE